MRSIDVHIHTNTQCNLRCIHCYEDTDESVEIKLDSDFELKLAEYFCGNFNANIHLEGGEIFLEETLIQVLGKLSDKDLKNITITTNGLIRTCDQKTIKVLRSISCLRVSIEGHTDSMHRNVRKCALQPILDNAGYYRDLGVRIVLRITLNKFNMNAMFAETIPVLEKMGFDEFQIYEMQPVGRAKAADIHIETPLTAFYEDWLAHPPKAKVRVSLTERRISDVESYLTRLQQIGVVEQRVGDVVSISIDVDGAVRVCPWDLTSNSLIQLSKKNLAELDSIIESQYIPHKCEYCTRLVLKGE